VDYWPIAEVGLASQLVVPLGRRVQSLNSAMAISGTSLLAISVQDQGRHPPCTVDLERDVVIATVVTRRQR
jgi:hypothetical protein